MPLLKPSTPPKKNTKPAGKTLPPKKGEAPHTKHAPHPAPPPSREPTLWDRLSAERKLDVVGIGLAFIGIIFLLGLISANRSAIVGGAIFFLSQIFGWGVYILPLGLLTFGLWLVFRKIERIPPLSTERVAGSIILFFWLLTVLHSSSPPLKPPKPLLSQARAAATLVDSSNASSGQGLAAAAHSSPSSRGSFLASQFYWINPSRNYSSGSRR
jgi:hypothetical protein